MAKNLRIHIAPLGYDTHRITQPIIQDKADKLYLVIDKTEKGYSRYSEFIRKKLEDELKDRIEIIEEQEDLWDLFGCINKFKNIIQKESGNIISINVSSGSKITAIAGMLTCMSTYNVKPYYARIKYPQKELEKLFSGEFKETIELDVFPLNQPRKEHIHILKILQEHDNMLNKSELIIRLSKNKILKPTSKNDKFPLIAKHNQVNRILKPMKELGYVEVIEDGRNKNIRLTDGGEKALTIFQEQIIEK